MNRKERILVNPTGFWLVFLNMKWIKSEGWKKIYHENTNQMKAGIATLI